MPYYPPTSIGIPLTDYGGADVWNVTAPSGAATKKYKWSLDVATGEATVFFGFVYATPGSTNTIVTIPLPADCPVPAVIAGMGDAASELMYVGTGRFSTTVTQTQTGVFNCSIIRNAANTAFEVHVISSTAVNATVLRVTISYPTF